MFVIIIDSCVMCTNHETDPTEEEFTVIGFQSLTLSQALISNNTNMTAEPCPLYPVSKSSSSSSSSSAAAASV